MNITANDKTYTCDDALLEKAKAIYNQDLQDHETMIDMLLKLEEESDRDEIEVIGYQVWLCLDRYKDDPLKIAEIITDTFEGEEASALAMAYVLRAAAK